MLQRHDVQGTVGFIEVGVQCTLPTSKGQALKKKFCMKLRVLVHFGSTFLPASVLQFLLTALERVTLNNSSDFRTNGHYRTPNPSPLAR